jgi:hypothetical protein
MHWSLWLVAIAFAWLTCTGAGVFALKIFFLESCFSPRVVKKFGDGTWVLKDYPGIYVTPNKPDRPCLERTDIGEIVLYNVEKYELSGHYLFAVDKYGGGCGVVDLESNTFTGYKNLQECPRRLRDLFRKLGAISGKPNP